MSRIRGAETYGFVLEGQHVVVAAWIGHHQALEGADEHLFD